MTAHVTQAKIEAAVRAAVTGHRSSAMVQLYAGAAAQKARAAEAQRKRK